MKSHAYLKNLNLFDANVAVVVVVAIAPSLSRDEGTAQTAIQVHTVNRIEIRLGERWQPISIQSLMAGSPTNSKADCHW